MRIFNDKLFDLIILIVIYEITKKGKVGHLCILLMTYVRT